MSDSVSSSPSNSMHSMSRAWMPCIAVRSTLQGGTWIQQPVLNPVAAQDPVTQKGDTKGVAVFCSLLLCATRLLHHLA